MLDVVCSLHSQCNVAEAERKKDTMSKEREMNDLYEEIFVHGTSFKSLLDDGFTLEEINYVLALGGLSPIALGTK